MKIYIDSANLKDIERLISMFPISGVTTNPTILSREKAEPWETLKSIRKIVGDGLDIHAQVLSQNWEDIVEEAKNIHEKLGENSFVKIPVTFQGIKAIKELKKEKVPTTATAIFTPMQGMIAAMAGAKWLAPYVNRLDMVCADGVKVASDLNQLIQTHNLESKVVAASFKNVEQVLRVAMEGIPCITLSPTLLNELIRHPLTDKAVMDFTNDFERLAGNGATLK